MMKDETSKYLALASTEPQFEICVAWFILFWSEEIERAAHIKTMIPITVKIRYDNRQCSENNNTTGPVMMRPILVPLLIQVLA